MNFEKKFAKKIEKSQNNDGPTDCPWQTIKPLEGNISLCDHETGFRYR